MNEYPRNTCSDHPLCVDDGTCMKVVVSPDSLYCEEHVRVPCRAFTRSGVRCRSFGTSEVPFCRNHRHLLGETPVSRSSPLGDSLTDSICQAVTKKRRRCKGNVLPGTGYCGNHQDYAISEARSTAVAPDSTIPVDEDLVAVEREAVQSDQHDLVVESDDFMPFDLVTPEDSFANEALDGAVGDAEHDHKQASNTDIVDDEWLLTGGSDDETARDVPVDNPDDVDDPDHLLHLREVFGADDVATSVPVDDEHVYEDESSDEKCQPVARSQGEHEFVHPSKWTWDSSFDERWAIIEAFIFVAWTLHDRVSSIVTRAIDQARMSFLEAEVRAKAHVYEGKAVLGGTIVSCIGRLEAIRALNPFAVIVEEASEVLEPLLLSCISSSTCKFEQIGDHLQLVGALLYLLRPRPDLATVALADVEI